jgi:hypothetical protein
MLTWAPIADSYCWLFAETDDLDSLLIALLAYCDETGGGLESN